MWPWTSLAGKQMVSEATYRRPLSYCFRELGRENRVRVVTSDGAEQLIILGHGALRVPASAFREEVETVEGEIAAVLRKNNQSAGKTRAVRTALEKAMEKQ